MNGPSCYQRTPLKWTSCLDVRPQECAQKQIIEFVFFIFPDCPNDQSSKSRNYNVRETTSVWEKKTATASLFRQMVSHCTFVIVTIAIILQYQSLDAYYMTQEVKHLFLGAEEEFNEVRQEFEFHS